MATAPDGRRALIQVRRDVAADWASANPVLAAGEPGWDTDNNILKIGDGVTAWSALAAAGNFVPLLTSYSLDVLGQSHDQTNFNSLVNDTAVPGNYRRTSTDAAGPYWIAPRTPALLAGTWNLRVAARTSIARGIVTIEHSTNDGADWSAVGVVDCYDISAATIFPDRSFTLLESGPALFRFTVSGKNESSSAHFVMLGGVWLRRTGD